MVRRPSRPLHRGIDWGTPPAAVAPAAGCRACRDLAALRHRLVLANSRARCKARSPGRAKIGTSHLDGCVRWESEFAPEFVVERKEYLNVDGRVG